VADGEVFLVERYIPRLAAGDVAALAARLAAATEELQAEGRPVHWLRSLAVEADETCFCLFSAATRADVEEANRRADAGYERILRTVAIENV
jgi:uncharacterized protein DUF4242